MYYVFCSITARWAAKHLPLLTGLTVAVLAAPPVRADADLIKTYSPIVNLGLLELETRGYWSVGRPRNNNDVQAVRFEAGYGVTDWWEAEPVFELQQAPGEGLKPNVVGMENIFQLTPEGEYFVDAGVYLEYEHSPQAGQPDEIEAKILLQKAIPPFLFRVNLAFDREFGTNADHAIEFGYSAEATVPVAHGRFGNIYSGLQAFGETGPIGNFDPIADQLHYVGPVVGGGLKIGNLPGVLEYEVGYLFGLTARSARGLPKVILEYEIPL